MQGLQQHLRASHDLFDYGFSEDSPMHLPAVSVEVAAGIYNTNHTFQSPEASLLGNSASKVSRSTCLEVPQRTLGEGRPRITKSRQGWQGSAVHAILVLRASAPLLKGTNKLPKLCRWQEVQVWVITSRLSLCWVLCAREAAAPDGPYSCSPCVQEFSFYCPPRLRQARRRVNKRALDGKSTLPEFDCQTPAAKRARLTHLATTRDVSRGAAPEDMVCHRHHSDPHDLLTHGNVASLILCRRRELIGCR